MKPSRWLVAVLLSVPLSAAAQTETVDVPPTKSRAAPETVSDDGQPFSGEHVKAPTSEGAAQNAAANAAAEVNAAENVNIDAAFDGARESLAGCDAEGRELLVGPVAISSFHDADFANARRACFRNELGFAIRGAPVIDSPDFYGNIVAAGVLSGSHALAPTLELFGALELFRADYVVNATLTSTKVTLGQASAGIAWSAVSDGDLLVTPIARLLLPTSLLAANVRTTGLELGAAASLGLLEQLELHGHAGAQGTIGLSAGPSLPRGGLFATVGLAYSPFTWGALVVDLQVHGGERAVIDYVAPAFALRFNPWRMLNIEAGASVPIAGEDRRLLVGGLRASWAL